MARRPPKPPAPSDRPHTPRHRGRRVREDTKPTPKKPNIQSLINAMPTGEEVQAIAEEVAHTSDQSTAILLASLVEHCLEACIVTHLPRHDEATALKLKERDGALSGFYSKIHLGYALGLYSKSFTEELDAIRHIRNAFAHSPRRITFETEQIVNECAKFRIRDASEQPPTFSAPRGQFVEACASVAKVLLAKVALRELQRLARRHPNIHDMIPEPLRTLLGFASTPGRTT